MSKQKPSYEEIIHTPVHLLDTVTFAAAAKCSQEMVWWWTGRQGGDLDRESFAKPITLAELFVQECESCASVMKVHDNLAWRNNIHAIRCMECATKVYEEHGDCDWYEARYVM